MRSKPPTVSTIQESNNEDGTGAAAAAGGLANNPVLLSMIQGKLGDLVGKQSGYIDNLSKPVKNRVYGLKSLQLNQMKLEAQFQKKLWNWKRNFRQISTIICKENKSLMVNWNQLLKRLKKVNN